MNNTINVEQTTFAVTMDDDDIIENNGAFDSFQEEIQTNDSILASLEKESRIFYQKISSKKNENIKSDLSVTSVPIGILSSLKKEQEKARSRLCYPFISFVNKKNKNKKNDSDLSVSSAPPSLVVSVTQTTSRNEKEEKKNRSDSKISSRSNKLFKKMKLQTLRLEETIIEKMLVSIVNEPEDSQFNEVSLSLSGNQSNNDDEGVFNELFITEEESSISGKDNDTENIQQDNDGNRYVRWEDEDLKATTTFTTLISEGSFPPALSVDLDNQYVGMLPTKSSIKNDKRRSLISSLLRSFGGNKNAVANGNQSVGMVPTKSSKQKDKRRSSISSLLMSFGGSKSAVASRDVNNRRPTVRAVTTTTPDGGTEKVVYIAKDYHVVFQVDGNKVIYNQCPVPKWDSGTKEHLVVVHDVV